LTRTAHSVPGTSSLCGTVFSSGESRTLIICPATTRRRTSTRRKIFATLSVLSEWIEKTRSVLRRYTHIRSPFNGFRPVWINDHHASGRINLLDIIGSTNLVAVEYCVNSWKGNSNHFRPIATSFSFTRSFCAKPRATCRPATHSPGTSTIPRGIGARTRIGIIRARTVRRAYHIGSRTAGKIHSSVATSFVHIARARTTTVTTRTIPGTSRIVLRTTRG